MKKQVYFVMWVAVILLSISVWGCGKDEGVTAPSGSEIVVNAGSTDATIGGDTVFNYTLVVLDSAGAPMQNAEVYISGAFAAPRDPADYQFSRVAGGYEPVNSGFIVVTDENGTYTFSIIVPAGVSFTDVIELRSGSAFGTVDLSFGA